MLTRGRRILRRGFGNSLRRRFVQNQEDISYTIMALLPTVGEQILEELNVEGVTHELQSKSRTSQISQSWIIDQPSTESSRQPSTSEPSPPNTEFPDSFSGAQLSDSITTASSALSYVNGTRLVSTRLIKCLYERWWYIFPSSLQITEAQNYLAPVQEVKPSFGKR